MSPERLRAVIDASVGIKLYVDDELSEAAHDLFRLLSSDPPAEFMVPDLFFIECTNVLLKYSRRYHRSLEDTRADVISLEQLSLSHVSTADLIQEALILAYEKNLTAYDACYAALARQMNVPLITVDKEMARAIEWAILLQNLNFTK
jgi:predicted nucleic acid-binding protein